MAIEVAEPAPEEWVEGPEGSARRFARWELRGIRGEAIVAYVHRRARGWEWAVREAAGSHVPEFAALLPRLFNPSRARRGEVVGALVGIEDPREAWEVLATRGLVPQTWLESNRREFRVWVNGHRLTSPRPLTLEMCVALATDPEGALTAEALGREVVQRLVPWGAHFTDYAVWMLWSAWTDRDSGVRYETRADPTASQVLGLVATALDVALERPRPGRGESSEPGPRRQMDAEADVESCRRWNEAAAAGLVVPAAKRVPSALVGREFAALPNPFEPLLALWATGYALHGIQYDGVVLAAPPL